MNRHKQLKIGDVESAIIYESHPCAGRKKFEVDFHMEKAEKAE